MSSIGFENLRPRKAPQENGVEVAFTDASPSIEMTAFSSLGDEEQQKKTPEVDQESEVTDQEETGDQSSLIQSQEGVDSDGVVREYEVALKHLGFGAFHILLLMINGTALLSDAIEVLSISFVLPVLNRPEEYGVGDSEEAVLSSIIFVGMLFGSYIWGSLADIIGRRTTIVASLTVSAVFGIFSAFSPWFWLFVLFRFFSGFGVGGSLPVIFPYTSEFIRNKYRGPYLGVQSMFWMFGRLLCGAFAWAIIPRGNINLPLHGYTFHSWRLFIAFSAIPSLIGALMYFFLPESPRFLLEVGKQEKAMKSLRLAYKLNRCCRAGTHEYPVKNIFLEATRDGSKGVYHTVGTMRQRMEAFSGRLKEVTLRTRDLFNLKNLRSTSLMLVIMFCLSFGSYGVTLWFPTYVDQITTQRETEKFQAFCNNTVTKDFSESLESYCGCSNTVFTDMDITDAQFKDFRIDKVIFSNVSFTNVNFSSVIFNGTQFTDGCQFRNSRFSSSYFNGTGISDDVAFDLVTIELSQLCYTNGSDVKVVNATALTADMLQPGNLSNVTCAGKDVQDIECTPPNSRIYRDSFFITASAFPGNVASAIAVYFLRRNYWLAFSLFASTVSVFLLYVSSSEVFVVVMLCIFTAVSTPAWNDSSLLIAELYPTYLRATAAGIHLLMARIGAIIGTNLFGLFIRVNPSIPILLVACILLVGGMAALGLPKTTRKTLLK